MSKAYYQMILEQVHKNVKIIEIQKNALVLVCGNNPLRPINIIGFVLTM